MDVSFILVNYFSEPYTRRCIASILEKTRGVSFEILVIDNHSGLDAEKFQADFPAVRLLLSGANLGYGAGCHRAASEAKGTYLYFLNNDTEVLNDVAAIQLEYAQGHPDAGLLGVQHIDGQGRPALSFDYFPSLISKFLGTGLLRKLQPRRFPSRRRTYDAPLEVDLVSGASLFISRQLYQSIGGFDPRFFLYCEEEDLALRVWKKGFKVVLVPAARILHHGGGSSAAKAALKKEFYISYFAFYRKHYGGFRTQLLKGITLAQFVWRFLFQDRKLWGPLIQWYLRGAPASESLRR